MNKVFFALSILSFFVGAFEAWAGGCGYVRLDSMKDVPVIDQTSLNICYSAAAAQMVDAWRFSHGEYDKKRVTSYLAAAIDTAEDPDLVVDVPMPFKYQSVHVDKRRTDINWGQELNVLNYLRKGYACDARSLAHGVGATDQGKLLDDLKGTYTANRAWKVLHGIASSLGYVTVTDEIMRRKLASTASACMASMGYGADQIPQLAELERGLETPNPMLYVQKELNQACKKDRFKVGVPAPVVTNSSDVKTLRKRVDTVLDRFNGQPLAVSFCGNILKEGKDFKSKCWGHAAVIMGRRLNPATNKCELLVRNSWGTKCGYAKSSGLECVEGEGNLWIPDDVLLKNTWQLINIE